jgi:hypothetical protein
MVNYLMAQVDKNLQALQTTGEGEWLDVDPPSASSFTGSFLG